MTEPGRGLSDRRHELWECECPTGYIHSGTELRCEGCGKGNPNREAGRVSSPSDCAGCGHVAKHHSRRDSVWNGLMAPYRVVWRCAWEGCGCPEFMKVQP